MKKIILTLVFCSLICGCATTHSPILTTKEESWYIPKGTTFQAKKKPDEPLKTYQAEDDLMVLYKGTYLELEQKANSCSH